MKLTTRISGFVDDIIFESLHSKLHKAYEPAGNEKDYTGKYKDTERER